MKAILAAVFGVLAVGAAQAQTVKVGVTVSTTGPGASLGIPEANSAKMLTGTVGGVPLEIIVLDDASDPTKAVANARKLLADEKVDVIVGSSTTPGSIALIEVAAENKVAVISLAGSSAVVSPMDEKRRWVFKSPQNDALMAEAIGDHMKAAGIKSVGFIGFSDAYGDGWLSVLTPVLAARDIKLTDSERYARSDTSVTGPILKIIATKPDAVLIAGAGTPAALPQKTLKERGYAGKIYQTHGAANSDFLRVGGKDLEGTVLPVGPVLVASQLPDANPVKKAGVEYSTKYEALYGPGSVSTFGAHMNDALTLIRAAVPAAEKVAKPGTPEFRVALRDALEGLKNIVYSQGIVTMSKDDHVGQDNRARVLVTVANGTWKLVGEGM